MLPKLGGVQAEFPPPWVAVCKPNFPHPLGRGEPHLPASAWRMVREPFSPFSPSSSFSGGIGVGAACRQKLKLVMASFNSPFVSPSRCCKASPGAVYSGFRDFSGSESTKTITDKRCGTIPSSLAAASTTRCGNACSRLFARMSPTQPTITNTGSHTSRHLPASFACSPPVPSCRITVHVLESTCSPQRMPPGDSAAACSG
mmetsp:Transcript_90174/g.209797  ORF Transcript_90174/g.209797 Transcript_90174/m.209797 type:complete len:201 (-) Transcript_90174:388-990(-)